MIQLDELYEKLKLSADESVFQPAGVFNKRPTTGAINNASEGLNDDIYSLDWPTSPSSAHQRN